MHFVDSSQWPSHALTHVSALSSLFVASIAVTTRAAADCFYPPLKAGTPVSLLRTHSCSRSGGSARPGLTPAPFTLLYALRLNRHTFREVLMLERAGANITFN